MTSTETEMLKFSMVGMAEALKHETLRLTTGGMDMIDVKICLKRCKLYIDTLKAGIDAASAMAKKN